MNSKELRDNVDYWQGFLDALEAVLSNEDRMIELRSKAIERLEKAKEFLKKMEGDTRP